MRDLSGAVARRRRAVLVAAADLAASALVARALGVPADTLAPWLLLPGPAAVVLHLTIMMRRPADLRAVAFLGCPRALRYGIRVTLTADGLRPDRRASIGTVDGLDRLFESVVPRT